MYYTINGKLCQKSSPIYKLTKKLNNIQNKKNKRKNPLIINTSLNLFEHLFETLKNLLLTSNHLYQYHH